jgi:nitrite reductase/ring-hydroxylating ferredoxin subunit
MQGNIVECAMHGWRYDVTTGAGLTNDYSDLRTWPVKIENGDIFIEIELPGSV